MYTIEAERLDGLKLTTKCRSMVRATVLWNRHLVQANYKTLVLRENGRTLRTWTLTTNGATLEK